MTNSCVSVCGVRFGRGRIEKDNHTVGVKTYILETV